ncbi:MAG: 50S ribosomal protein L11 methyltransferase [Pyrinomonadaceae bacterium]
MTNDKWFALEITVIEPASEAVEFALNELDSLGTEINNLGKRQTETLKVVGYFNQKPADAVLQNQLGEALRIYGFDPSAVKAFGWSEVEDQDWLFEWKKHWKPTETQKFIIAPPWEEIESAEKIVIRIEPNMAFGTGTHETTRLCLRAIERHFKPQMSFFDLGTGTGILAIAADKLRSQIEHFKFQRAEITGCDTDADSVRIARENADLNGADGIEFFVGSISAETPRFDFVCANVTADVIGPLLELLLEKAEEVLVLSGILTEQKDQIAEKLRSLGVEDFIVETDGEWVGITVRMKKIF